MQSLPKRRQLDVEGFIEDIHERELLDFFDDGPTKTELERLRTLKRRRRGELERPAVH